jgi:hypothetical protein
MRLDIKNEIQSTDDVYSSYVNSFKKFTRASPFQQTMASSIDCQPVKSDPLATISEHVTYRKLLTRDMNKKDNVDTSFLPKGRKVIIKPHIRDKYLPERKTFLSSVPDTNRLGQTDREKEDAKRKLFFMSLGGVINKSAIAALFGSKPTPASIVKNIGMASSNKFSHIPRGEIKKIVNDALGMLLDADLGNPVVVNDIAVAIQSAEKELGDILPKQQEDASLSQKMLNMIKSAPKSFSNFLKSGGKKYIVPLFKQIKEQVGKIKIQNGNVVFPNGMSFSLMQILKVASNVSGLSEFAAEHGLDEEAVSFFRGLAADAFSPDVAVDMPVPDVVPVAPLGDGDVLPPVPPSEVPSNLVARLSGGVVNNLVARLSGGVVDPLVCPYKKLKPVQPANRDEQKHDGEQATTYDFEEMRKKLASALALFKRQKQGDVSDMTDTGISMFKPSDPEFKQDSGESVFADNEAGFADLQRKLNENIKKIGLARGEKSYDQSISNVSDAIKDYISGDFVKVDDDERDDIFELIDAKTKTIDDKDAKLNALIRLKQQLEKMYLDQKERKKFK